MKKYLIVILLTIVATLLNVMVVEGQTPDKYQLATEAGVCLTSVDGHLNKKNPSNVVVFQLLPNSKYILKFASDDNITFRCENAAFKGRLSTIEITTGEKPESLYLDILGVGNYSYILGYKGKSKE